MALSAALLAVALSEGGVEGPVVSLNDVSISGQVGPANSNGTAIPEVHEPTIGSIVKEAATSVAREVDKSLIKVRQMARGRRCPSHHACKHLRDCLVPTPPSHPVPCNLIY